MRKLICLGWFLLGIVVPFFSFHVLEKYVFPTYVNSTITVDGSILDSLVSSSSYTFPIITQDRFSFCGVASLVNVLISYGLASPTQTEILKDQSSSANYWDVLLNGLTLDDLKTLFDNQKHFETSIVRAQSMDEMKDVMRELVDVDTRLIVNFSRVPLFGENIGHHTPLGGYDELSGNVLLLDVTEGYGNYLVKLETLFVAIQTYDSETGLQRGFLLVKRI